MGARRTHAPGDDRPRGSSRVLVSRATGPLAAAPVAALAAVVCAFLVLARDEERARRARPAPLGPRAPALAAHEVELEPPGSVEPEAAPRAPRARDPGAARDRDPGPTDGSALERALAVMVDPLRPWPERLEAALTLGRRRARELLVGASTSPDESVRGLAAAGLDLLLTGPRDEVVLSALTRLVDDPSTDVSSRAAEALARSPEGRRSLVSRLRGGDTPGLVHMACVEALGERGTPDEVPALLGWATTEGPVGELAAAAVRAICARAGVESPLPPPEPPGEPRPARE